MKTSNLLVAGSTPAEGTTRPSRILDGFVHVGEVFLKSTSEDIYISTHHNASPPVESMNPPTNPNGASHLALATLFLPKITARVNLKRMRSPRSKSMVAVHGRAVEKSMLLRKTAPINEPMAPGIATLYNACQSTFQALMCAKPDIKDVTISEKCTIADATAGL